MEAQTATQMHAWWLAARPKTLWAALAPVAVGSGLALQQGRLRPVVLALALLGAICIQIATNLFNDWADFQRGADTHERLGPLRVTQQGLIAAPSVLKASVGVAGVAVLAGVGLVPFGGLPLIAVGVASLLAGAAYTGGPLPLAYVGLGDIFALVFFGPVAVCTTVMLHGGTQTLASWALGIALGAWATAILALNNLRDARTDALAHKRTLAVRLGARFARAEHAVAVFLPFCISTALAWLERRNVALLLPLALLPQAVSLVRQVRQSQGRALNALLGETARLEMAYSVLVVVGLTTKI